MSDSFRDTVFGQLVRLLSRKKLLKFPDELDPTAWELFAQRDKAPAASSTHKEQISLVRASHTATAAVNDGREKAQNQGTTMPSKPSREKTTDFIPVDWYGPDDRENPQNWSASRKLLVMFQICILNFGIYIGSSIYTPGEPGVMEEFGVGEIVATLGLSLFVLGYGLGPMLFSPMSEIPAVGRSRIYFWTLFAFVLLQLPTGFATDMSMLLVFRFLAGFFGGPVLATFFGAFALPICLFWYGWTSRPGVHWMVPLVGSGSFTISIITLFMPVLSYLGMAYPQYAASVLAGNALFRASCGVLFPLFARALFRNLGIGPGNSLLAGLSILFIPIPFILFYFGDRIRHWSKNATHV